MAAAWFLGIVVVALVLLAWLRGVGRLVIPMLAILAVVTLGGRLVRKIREPLP